MFTSVWIVEKQLEIAHGVYYCVFMLEISRKTCIFVKRNTQFMETILKTICCHTATVGLKGLKHGFMKAW